MEHGAETLWRIPWETVEEDSQFFLGSNLIVMLHLNSQVRVISLYDTEEAEVFFFIVHPALF
jgi:hypothetical protein